MGVGVSLKKIRYRQDLTIHSSQSASNVNADTDVASAADAELGEVLRDFVWRYHRPRCIKKDRCHRRFSTGGGEGGQLRPRLGT